MFVHTAAYITNMHHNPHLHYALHHILPYTILYTTIHFTTIDAVYVLYGKGCPRRCGGLGDILSGITATAMHWATQVLYIYPFC